MSRHLIDGTITFVAYTTNGDGLLTDADTDPVLTVTGPSGESTPTLTNTDTGVYEGSFEPDVAGIWRGLFAATVAGDDVRLSTRWVVHDGDAEAAGTAFPAGLSSWVPAV